MDKPRIAIPEIGQNVKNYIAALHAAGMEAVVISIQEKQIVEQYQQEYLDYSEFHAETFDGLLLPGGADVNPVRYGQEMNGSVGVSDALDELQFAVLDAFVSRKKPVFGVCRGLQVINVYFGGTLVQHLPTSFRHAKKAGEPDRHHGCVAEETSWLGMLYGREFLLNSAHHQAVDRCGEGLVTDAWSKEDGVVEAMHHTSLPVYCVQWHPERTCLAWRRNDTVNGLETFRFFCEAAGGSSYERQDSHAGIMLHGMGL